MKRIFLIKQIIALCQQAIILLRRKKPNGKKVSFRILAEAMANFEGFHKPGSRAQRNNNPLNIKWSPFSADTDGTFVIFSSPEKGWEAAIWDLKQKAKGNTRTKLGPNSTLKELIFVWTHTDQFAYLSFVSQVIGVSEDYKLKYFI